MNSSGRREEVKVEIVLGGSVNKRDFDYIYDSFGNLQSDISFVPLHTKEWPLK